MAKITHLVLKMGKENYVWSDSGHTESCFVVEFCLGKEKEKPLGGGEEPGDQWGGKLHLLVRK